MDHIFRIIEKSPIAFLACFAALSMVLALVRPILFFLKNKGSGPINMTIRVGSSPATFAQFGSQTGPQPEAQRLETEWLERARQHLDQGGTVDELCAQVNPAYPTMGPGLQQAFRQAAEAAIERYRQVHG
jgi:hypothetical protein